MISPDEEAEADRVAEEGLGAAAAIGRDVDGGRRARALSGATGTVSVTRKLYGERRTLFPFVARVVTWTPSSTSWTFRDARADFELDVTTSAFASPGHPDQLSGSTGSIATSFLEVRRPARVVRRWSWVRADGTEMVDGGTTLTAVLRERTDDDGEPWTTVGFRHEGLPVEWLDDMDAWWTYQLAMADFRDFGSD